MATIDLRQGDHASTSPLATDGLGPVSVRRIEIDFATAKSGGVVGAGDTLQVLHLPVGTMVLDCAVDVIKLAGAALTIDVGPYTHSTDAAITADGFINGMDLNASLGIKRVTLGTLLTGGIHWVNASDVASDISILSVNAGGAAKIALLVTVIALS